MINNLGQSPSRQIHPSRVLSFNAIFSFLTIPFCFAQTTGFISRNSDTLVVGGHPFYFVGANAYYLMESAAHGDTATVNALFSTCRSLGMTVIRTWGFFDSDDSLNPAVIQYAPGTFNEQALVALDYVVFKAKQSNVRLLIPFVNSWDDYGGMNQYVRWRTNTATADEVFAARYTARDVQTSVTGSRDQTYRLALNPVFGHDDFYRDAVIQEWFRNYIAVVLQRVNSFTGIEYRNEPAIFGWELANEPRSSDRSGMLVHSWIVAMSSFIKSIDQNHLVGTGEEGFDVSPSGYSLSSYGNQSWLFDGTGGVSFTSNSGVSSIDFAGIHLYPESWNLSSGAGNAWIEDHAAKSNPARIPLIVGEYGVRQNKRSTYESWLTSADLSRAAGALVWQLLEGPRSDEEGFGFRCNDGEAACGVLQQFAARFAAKSAGYIQPLPLAPHLYQNYPNPFNNQTTISYDLSDDRQVLLSIFSTTGQYVSTVVDRFQHAGLHRELLDGTGLSSGMYFYRIITGSTTTAEHFSTTRKLVLVK